MDTKLVSEDIGSEPSKMKNNEESWIKRVKIKFKAGGNLENDSEEDEKLRKIVKGGTMDEIKENNKKINIYRWVGTSMRWKAMISNGWQWDERQ